VLVTKQRVEYQSEWVDLNQARRSSFLVTKQRVEYQSERLDLNQARRSSFLVTKQRSARASRAGAAPLTALAFSGPGGHDLPGF
jgi:hypothetical protein